MSGCAGSALPCWLNVASAHSRHLKAACSARAVHMVSRFREEMMLLLLCRSAIEDATAHAACHDLPHLRVVASHKDQLGASHSSLGARA